jgi:hypothetical protein
MTSKQVSLAFLTWKDKDIYVVKWAWYLGTILVEREACGTRVHIFEQLLSQEERSSSGFQSECPHHILFPHFYAPTLVLLSVEHDSNAAYVSFEQLSLNRHNNV